MKIVTRHYDNGKADAQIHPHDYNEVTEETEKYDRYVDDIGAEDGTNLIYAARQWVKDNLTCEAKPGGFGNLNITNMAHQLVRSVHGKPVDISRYI